MITGSEDISIGGEDTNNKSRSLNVNAKTLRFAHKFVGGETALNLLSLTMPSEISTWSNPSSSDIAAANLMSTSANLIVKSSTGAELFEGVDFVVTSNSTLAFINGYSPLPGEIFVGRFNLPVANILVGDVKDYKKTVAVTAGQTIVNVGFEYKVNDNPTQQVGDVKVNLNGLSRLLRNVGNVTAAPLADGNYEEYDPTGSGYSTAIRLNNPIAADGFMIFEGGLALASADVKVFSALDRLGTIVTKLAEDASAGFHGDNDLTRYLTASTSEIERKTFGDLLTALYAPGVVRKTELYEIKGPVSFAAASPIIPMDNTVPQITEGAQIFNINFTKTRAENKLLVELEINASEDTNWADEFHAALFVDGGANAVAVGNDGHPHTAGTANASVNEAHIQMRTLVLTSGLSVNLQVRGGWDNVAAQAWSLNRHFNHTGAQFNMGNSYISSVKVTEIQV